MKIIRGARDKIELNKLRKFLNIFEIIEIDELISYKARYLINNYSLSHNLHIADALIAATCLVKNLKLWTYNKKDFIFIDEIEFFEPL